MEELAQHQISGLTSAGATKASSATTFIHQAPGNNARRVSVYTAATSSHRAARLPMASTSTIFLGLGFQDPQFTSAPFSELTSNVAWMTAISWPRLRSPSNFAELSFTAHPSAVNSSIRGPSTSFPYVANYLTPATPKAYGACSHVGSDRDMDAPSSGSAPCD